MKKHNNYNQTKQEKTIMNNFEFLKKYQQLQHTIMFDEFIELGFTTVGYCGGDASVFWNFSLVNQILTENQLSKIEETMYALNRQPAVCFENRKDIRSIIHLLKEHDYKFEFEDSWMFYSREDIDTSRFGQVKKVTNEPELEIFLKTFNACYQKNDPQNVYGELGDYLSVAERVWRRHYQNDRLEYFIVCKGNKPVAVSTLTNYEKIGYISNVGSLQEVRGQGFGKIASLFCVEQSKRNGNTEHCLATEEGTYANEFYKWIGFDTRFSAVCYAK